MIRLALVFSLLILLTFAIGQGIDGVIYQQGPPAAYSR